MCLFIAAGAGNIIHMTTWKPADGQGELDAAAKNKLPDSAYAFAKARKEPLTDAERGESEMPQQDAAGCTDHQAADREPEAEAQRAVGPLDRPARAARLRADGHLVTSIRSRCYLRVAAPRGW